MLALAPIRVLIVVVVVFVVSALLGALLRPLVPVSLRFAHLLVAVALPVLTAVSVLAALAVRLLALSSVVPLRFVQFVAASPPQTVHVLIQEQVGRSVRLSALAKLPHDWYQAVSVERRVMLLGKSHGSQLPIRHLLTFADLVAEHLLGNLGETSLLPRHIDLTIVGLRINKVAHVLVKVHLG